MSFKIEDGKGTGYAAQVTSDNKLSTDSISMKKISDVSLKKGLSFSWSSRYSVGPGSSIIYLQNTSPTRNLVVENIDVGGVSGGNWELWTCTTDGAGTVVSGVNLNLTSSSTPEARCFGNGNITSNTSGLLLGYAKHPNSSEAVFTVSDTLILGQNNAIMVKKDPGEASTVSGTCTVLAYFE